LRDSVALHLFLAAGSQVTLLVNAVREFSSEQLCSEKWPAEASLKEYLLYSAPELEDHAWFREEMSDDIQLRHAYQLYHFIRSLG
jgi:hypothetical protein